MPSTQPKNEPVKIKNIAAVILAAGESSRFGQTKQLIEFRGKTFIENVIETALAAALSPITVVLGAHAEKIKAVLNNYQGLIEVIENPDWQIGQSSSIRVAIDSVQNRCQAAIFFLSDQPQIPSELILSLIKQYVISVQPIVAPFVGERRGNPVLFDKICFDRLKQLNGNQGGRELFSEYGLSALQWNDSSILLDVDSQTDYQKLRDEYE